MQKIVLKTPPDYNFGNYVRMVAYVVALYFITIILLQPLPPMVVLHVLLSWALIYNVALAFWGTPPAIDNIYFLESNGNYTSYPLLDGSEVKYAFLKPTELFVMIISYRDIKFYMPEESCQLLNSNSDNIFVLLLIVFFWRKLILLLRGIYRYGQQSLINLSPRQYVQQEKNLHGFFAVLSALAVYFFFLIWIHNTWQTNHARDVRWLMYTGLLIFFFSGSVHRLNGGIIIMIALTALTVLRLHFAGIAYSVPLFLLLFAILFAYLIMFLAKDVLLRESHVLFNGGACDELNQDIKNCIQFFVKETRFIVYLTMSLYFVFIAFLFTVIFRFDFALQFLSLFG